MFYMSTGITLIADRLVEKRKRANLSQEGLAALVGKRIGEASFHQTNISAYERGVKTPSLPVFRALAQILDTNMEWLAGETDDDKPSSDLEDQVVVGVKDRQERELLQEMINNSAALPHRPASTGRFFVARFPSPAAMSFENLRLIVLTNEQNGLILSL